MVVLLFLLSPVLVELVDFNSGVALLEQVKSLQEKITRSCPKTLGVEREERKKLLSLYLIDFTEAAPAQQVQQQVPLIQSRMVFKPV